jgi:large subunit ribosomal protein L24
MAMPEGGIKELDVTVHISNVLPIDPSTNKPAKVGFKIEDGKKIRVFKKSGNVLS